MILPPASESNRKLLPLIENSRKIRSAAGFTTYQSADFHFVRPENALQFLYKALLAYFFCPGFQGTFADGF